MKCLTMAMAVWDAHVTHCPVRRRWRGGRKVLCSAGSVRLYSGAGDVACVDTVDTVDTVDIVDI